MANDSAGLLRAFVRLDSDTLHAIVLATAAEADSFGEDSDPEAEAFGAIYAFISAIAEVALLRKRTGVAV